MAWIAATMPAGLPLYWVTFNILGILQQLYVNWSSNKLKLDTGTGFQVETQITNETLEVTEDVQIKNEKDTDAGREKGGKKGNETPDSRKKRKKR